MSTKFTPRMPKLFDRYLTVRVSRMRESGGEWSNHFCSVHYMVYMPIIVELPHLFGITAVKAPTQNWCCICELENENA